MTRITFSDGKVVMRDGQVGTEEACCCGCDCNDFINDADLKVEFNGVEVENSYFSFSLTPVCAGVMTNPSLCAFTFDGDTCHVFAWRDWVCKQSIGLAGDIDEDGQFDGLMENGQLYLVLTLLMDTGPAGNPAGCAMLSEHRIYKLKEKSSDCCDVELELKAIGNLRGDPARGDIQWTAASYAGYPLPPLEDPESCSCFATYFDDPVVTVDCNPLP